MDGVAAQQQLPVGAKLQVQKIIDEDTFWREGEVLASRIGVNNILEYYIHYVNFNKRLDEWVPVDRMNLSSAIMPKELKKDGKRKFGKGKAPNTGSSTTSTSLNATLLASAASGDRLPIATDFGDTKSGMFSQHSGGYCGILCMCLCIQSYQSPWKTGTKGRQRSSSSSSSKRKSRFDRKQRKSRVYEPADR